MTLGSSPVRRWRCGEVAPLEIWNTTVEGRPLNKWLHEKPADLARILGLILGQLATGKVLIGSRPTRCGPFPGIGHVHIFGGATPDLPSAIPGSNVPVTVAKDPRFGAALGGRSLGQSPVVVDVGQTAVKVVHGETKQAVPRPSDLRSDPSQRSQFVGFVAKAMHDISGETRPKSFVLALPCGLDDDLVASRCSYPFPDRDRRLVVDILEEAGLAGVPGVVLNDAELAAFAASEDPLVPRESPCLVLTLGTGVGGAVLRHKPVRG